MSTHLERTTEHSQRQSAADTARGAEQRAYARSTGLFVAAAVLIVASIFFPYWHMRLNAPQFPRGLDLTVYIDHMVGDISTIDGLNHYIGMKPLADAAQLERTLAPVALTVIVLLVAATAIVHRRWFAPLVLPAMLLPLVFLGDMYFWLRSYGLELDPRAALSSSVKPFVPQVLGHGTIGQFSTDASLQLGFWLATGASMLILLGLHERRRARRMLAGELAAGAAAPGDADVTGATLAVMAFALLSVAGKTIIVGPGGDVVSLADALAAADDGDRIEVRGGVHPGPIVVRRAVALVGVGRPVLDGGRQGTVVTFEVPGGRLEGFVVRGSGERNDKEDAGVIARGQVAVVGNVFEDVLYGIDVKAGRLSVVEDNTVTSRDVDIARRGDAIRLWESHGSRVVGNAVSAARDVVIWYSRDVLVRGNTVRQSRYGLHFMYATGSQVEGNTLEGNAVGAYAMYSEHLTYRDNRLLGNHGPSGYGLALKDTNDVTVAGNVSAGNRTGLYFDNSPMRPTPRNQITDNIFAYNDIGLAFMPSVKGNDFAGNRFVENGQQVALVAGGSFQGNDWTPAGKGNYWSNYAGYDADRDGVGDLPYQEVSLFNDLVTRHAALRLFSFSPAQSALDLAARAFPVFRPDPVLTDSAPLVRLPEAAQALPTRSRAPMLLVTLALVGLALAVGAWGFAQ